MGQSWNGPAVKKLFTVARRPSLLEPCISVQDLSHINISSLVDRGIKGVIFDKDNTITAPYALEAHPQVKKALEDFKNCNSLKLVILSNSAGTPDDKHFLEALAITKSLGIPVLRHLEKKPEGLQETLDFFQMKPQELAVVGDRILTDIVFGNLHGMTTIHTQPLTTKNDNKLAMVARFCENKLLLPLVSKEISKKVPQKVDTLDTLLAREDIDVNKPVYFLDGSNDSYKCVRGNYETTILKEDPEICPSCRKYKRKAKGRGLRRRLCGRCRDARKKFRAAHKNRPPRR
mgnify:CR=1 FL=1